MVRGIATAQEHRGGTSGYFTGRAIVAPPGPRFKTAFSPTGYSSGMFEYSPARMDHKLISINWYGSNTQLMLLPLIQTLAVTRA